MSDLSEQLGHCPMCNSVTVEERSADGKENVISATITPQQLMMALDNYAVVTGLRDLMSTEQKRAVAAVLLDGLFGLSDIEDESALIMLAVARVKLLREQLKWKDAEEWRKTVERSRNRAMRIVAILPDHTRAMALRRIRGEKPGDSGLLTVDSDIIPIRTELELPESGWTPESDEGYEGEDGG